MNASEGAGPVRAAPTRLPDVDRRGPFLSREHMQPAYHPMGGGAGIRGGGPEMVGYCYLHEEWAWEDDCTGCADYEAVDRDSDCAGAERCRHTISEEEDEGDGE